MKNNENIQITIQNGEQIVKLKLPPKVRLLERSLKLLNRASFSEEENNYQEEYDDYRYPARLSKELRKSKSFRSEFNKATEEFEEWYFQQCKIKNLIEIQSNNRKLSISQSLNKKEWDKLFASAFDKIIKKNVEFLIVHISSTISDDEKAKILDDVSQLFFSLPIKKYYTHRNNKSTLVEIIFFGSDVERSTYGEF